MSLGIKYDMPEILTRIPEVNACYQIAQELIDEFIENLEKLERELHTDTAGEIGISHKEKMYKMKPGATDTLEERRFRILIYEKTINILNGKNLKTLVSDIAGDDAALTVDKKAHTVSVSVGLSSQKKFDLLKNTIRDYIPVWMQLIISQIYRTYESYSDKTYEELSDKTWDEIKKEVN